MSGLEVALASALLKTAGGKLGSLITSEFASITGVQKDLSEMQDIHGEITSWLSVFRDRTIESDPSLRWVIKLTDVAYDIHDLLDEVHLEAEKQKVDNYNAKKDIATFFRAKSKSFQFRCKVVRRIKAIKVTFAAIVQQRNNANAILNNLAAHGLPVGSTNVPSVELSLLGHVEESKIPRRNKKDDIVSMLLGSNGENCLIVSIVGLGGSGKTTLAKHICHDKKIKEHFKDTIFWVHVSQEFCMEKLIGKLFGAIFKKKTDLLTPQHMLDEISNILTCKEFLLVLDDAWHDDRYDWEQFMVYLKSGALGSKILLTTRDRKVAEVVNSRNIFELAFLSNGESWSLFLNSSRCVEKDLDNEFIQVGKEAVNKCGGVPLAIRILGGILHENRKISTWKTISESKLWNVRSIKDRVFVSLKLSYIHLKDEIKQCFTFCSIFPKGYAILKDRLISQWIAHGFISPMNEDQLEGIASHYDSLVKIGFLQGPCEKGLTNQIIYSMHDLVHDLTQLILQDEMMRSLLNSMTTRRCRYLYLTSGIENIDISLFDRVRALYVSGRGPSFDKPIKKNHYVRSVILRYNIDAFPLFILKLEYIGYLEIDGLNCSELPEAISGCWNLQSLHLINCKGLVKLPESIGKLKRLRTLEVWCTDLDCLPRSIGDCRDLRRLQLNCCLKLKEIPISVRQIENLKVLHIVSCPKVQQVLSGSTGEFSKIQEVNLAGCYNLQDLPNTLASCTLRSLNLSQTRLGTLPKWVTLIHTLECLDLGHCTELLELPSGIVSLKRLEILNIVGCLNLRCIPAGLRNLTRLTRLGRFPVGRREEDARISELENIDMISGNMVITNLQYVKDTTDAEKACLKRKSNIHSLELNWSTSEIEELVSNLEHDLTVLNALEPPAKVKTLSIGGYRGLCLPYWMGGESDTSCLEGIMLRQSNPYEFHCLTDLMLAELPNLKHLRLVGLTSLITLQLDGMPKLEELWTITIEIEEEELGAKFCFPSLSSLKIRKCPKLNVKPYFPPSLEFLRLEQSNEMVLSPSTFSLLLPPSVNGASSSSNNVHSTVPRLKELELNRMSGSASDWEFLQHLTGLESLKIWNCNDLTKLPECIRSLTSLRHLYFYECSNLSVFPESLGELCSLEDLVVWDAPKMASLPQSTENLTSLVSLYIVGWDNMEQLPEVIQHLATLQRLYLSRCHALTELPEWIEQLSALQKLQIIECSALQSLPQSIRQLTSLKKLEIIACSPRWS